MKRKLILACMYCHFLVSPVGRRLERKEDTVKAVNISHITCGACHLLNAQDDKDYQDRVNDLCLICNKKG
jgi:hypothetical protein